MLRGMTSDVEAHLETITPAVRHRDAESLLALMRRATGEEPRLWGTVIGFGTYHYRYPSGREGDGPAAAFAARKAATVVYVVDGVGAHADLLERLGPHTTESAASTSSTSLRWTRTCSRPSSLVRMPASPPAPTKAGLATRGDVRKRREGVGGL
jgi:hypothetical protein